MRTIKIFDTTLRDGEQSPGCSMTLNEKLDIAEALERLRIDIIEAGFPAASPGDFKAVSEIAKLIKNSSVAGLSRLVKRDIEQTYGALKHAAAPRLHLFIATSPIHLQYKLKMTEDEVLEAIAESLSYARQFFSDIEFSFEDASRTPHAFLAKAAAVVVKNGASTLNLPDTVGYSMPHEIAAMFRYVMENTDGIDKIALSSHTHNDLGMAVANSIAAVRAGATQVEGAINGIGERAGNAALEEVIMAIKTRGEVLDAKTNANTQEIYRTSKLVSSVIGVKLPPNKAIVGGNAFTHASGIHQHGVLQNRATYEIMTPEDIGIAQNHLKLSKHSGKHAFRDQLAEMGYNLSEEEITRHFETFKMLADKKRDVSRRDIEAILKDANRRRPERIYTLESFDINSYKGGASAEITLLSEGRAISEKMSGDGPVDASFKAINSITGFDFVLDDYSVHAVSEGKDALGEAVVKLKYGERTRTGRGFSTDVLEASIIAYVSASNKLIDEQKNLREREDIC